MTKHDSFDRDTLAIAPGDSQSWSMPTSFASGRYLIRRPLGQGGQKRVYLARDDRLDRDVVIALSRLNNSKLIASPASFVKHKPWPVSVVTQTL